MRRSIKFWLFISIVALIIFGEGKIFNVEGEADFFDFGNENLESQFFIIQGNTLKAISNPNNPKSKIIKKLKAIVTAYSSSPWQTDNDPYITAAGTFVRDGIVANNFFPFGTKIRIPEIFGEKIFIVEDRMSWKKGKYQIDVWFEDYSKAKEFGAKMAYIEVLEN